MIVQMMSRRNSSAKIIQNKEQAHPVKQLKSIEQACRCGTQQKPTVNARAQSRERPYVMKPYSSNITLIETSPYI